MGCYLSTDDFGTGYSLLSHLKRFPIYKLKIDRSFVSDLGDDTNDRAIIRIAQALGIATTAEGVETQEQLVFLQGQGCTYAQGYHCGRPMPPDQLETMARGLQHAQAPLRVVPPA